MSNLITENDHRGIAVADGLELTHEEPMDTMRTLMSTTAGKTFKPIGTSCDKTYHAVKSSGIRPLNVVTLIVLHATQSNSAQSSARWFTNPAALGSTHLVVDDFECYRTLNNNEIPWGAKGANYKGFHIEQTGWAHWTRTLWSQTHRRTLQRAAYKTAYHCRLFGIPTTFRTADQLKKGLPGITTHAECSKAFGGDHSDPGSGWPRTLFMTMVKGYYLNLRSVKRLPI